MKILNIDKITDERLVELFTLVKKGDISKDAVEQVLIGIADKDKSPAELISILGLTKMDDGEIEAIIDEIVNQQLDKIKERGMAAKGAIMGAAMKQLGGKVDGKTVSDLVTKAIKSHTS